MFNWDDMKIFLGCAEAGSFRKASEQLQMQNSTVVRRIERLEGDLKITLFARLANGIKLTQEGQNLLHHARRFGQGERDVLQALAAADPSHRGIVRIGTTDGLGTYWLTPLLVEFQRANPNIVVEVLCANEPSDVKNLKADISIQYDEPTVGDLVRKKIGRHHIYTFASKKYLSIYGRPSSAAEMVDHRLVDQVGAQLNDGIWPAFFNLPSIEGVVGVRSNSSISVYLAIESGAGIGALPTYIPLLGAEIEPVDVGFQHAMDLWLTYHPEAMKLPRVRRVADWVQECFNPRTYPWFGDSFIHPRDLVATRPLPKSARRPDRPPQQAARSA